MNATRALAGFAADTRFEDLPRAVVRSCVLTVLDAVGAGFVGSVQPWAQRILAVVQSLGGAEEASVIHHGWRTDVARAALANGVLIGSFECEPLTGSHAAGTVLPAALAVCEREHLDGRALLTAMAVGFEVSSRLAAAATGLETARGFHNPSVHGPLGAAAAVGKLLGLDAGRLASALGIAGSGSAGLLEFAWSGGDTKRLHLGRASQLGLEAALLARQGVNGPPTVLEGRSGFFNAFSTERAKPVLLDGLGAKWTIEPPWLKSYATHVTHQAVVAAIQELKRDHPLEPAAIGRVVIRGAPRIMEERHTEREPHDVLGGQYSLPFTAAVALTRDLSDPLAYDEDAVRDPVVRDLARRIELVPAPGEAHEGHGVWSAEVLVDAGGRQHVVHTRPYKGSTRNPFTWDEAAEKFRRFTRSVLPPPRAAALIEAVGGLEAQADVAEIARLAATA